MPRQSRLPPHIAKLYSKQAWYRRRNQQLNAEPCCVACRKLGVLVKATVADHIEPATDEHSFWHGALQSLCAMHHQAKRQAESNGKQWRLRMGCGPDGMPRDPEHQWNRGGG
jgi:5-methylcytosine-specific restriction enzyme A